MSQQTWVLGTELEASKSIVPTPNHGVIFPAAFSIEYNRIKVFIKGAKQRKEHNIPTYELVSLPYFLREMRIV